MSVLSLALIGGLISFASTALGSTLVYLTYRTPRFFRFKFSMDFALGLMLSAVAFSLVAPAAKNSIGHPVLLAQGIVAFIIGGALIYGLKNLIERKQIEKSSQLILALSLMVHNLPEGMASGAALAGLDFKTATSLLASISIQNIPEGFLMVLVLQGMGFSRRVSFSGGLGSGVVEFLGGGLSGVALTWTTEALPVILMTAAGAMFTAVAIEMREHGNFRDLIRRPEFAWGLVTIPALTFFLN